MSFTPTNSDINVDVLSVKYAKKTSSKIFLESNTNMGEKICQQHNISYGK